MPNDQPRSVAELLSSGPLPRLLDHARLLARLQQALQTALPADLAPHCRVLNLRNQTLTLAAQGSAWAARLRYQVPALLQHFARQRTVTVRTIRVKVAGPTAKPQEKPKRNAHLSPSNARLLEQTASALQDPGLRAALLRVASRGKKAKED